MGKTYLAVHDALPQQQVTDVTSLGEVVIRRIPSLGLAHSSAVDEPADHVVLSPVYLGRIGRVRVGIALMSSNEVGHMHFPIQKSARQRCMV